MKHVSGETDMEEVQQALIDLKDGKIDGICNSMLLTEGWDIPWADLLLNLRPTKSWGLYTQIMGRLTRLFAGKDYGLILDPLWLCDEHSMLKRPASLLARDDEEEEAITEKLKEGDIEDLLEAQSEFAAEKEESLRERLEKNSKRKSREVDAMDFFLSIGDIDGADYEPMSSWEKDKMTQGQRDMLIRNGFDIDSITCKGQASQIIEAIINRGKADMATVKMCRYAQQKGMENPYNKSFADVKQFLDNL